MIEKRRRGILIVATKYIPRGIDGVVGLVAEQRLVDVKHPRRLRIALLGSGDGLRCEREGVRGGDGGVGRVAGPLHVAHHGRQASSRHGAPGPRVARLHRQHPAVAEERVVGRRADEDGPGGARDGREECEGEGGAKHGGRRWASLEAGEARGYSGRRWRGSQGSRWGPRAIGGLDRQSGTVHRATESPLKKRRNDSCKERLLRDGRVFFACEVQFARETNGSAGM
jgi:hypothetical protein